MTDIVLSATNVPSLGNLSPVWRRAWHPVAHAEEIAADVPVQVIVAGEAWVIARLDGRLVAFEDRCPHRLAPLSAGHVTTAGDGKARLSCAYHGWRFDAAGRCDLIPFKLITRSDIGGDAGKLETFIKEEDQILDEDLAILERYPSALLPLDPRAEVHTRADRLSVAWRRLMADAVAADARRA